MSKNKSTTKALHPRNKYQGSYDFEGLISTYPALAKYVEVNAYQNKSINFADAAAVKALNKALLMQYYHIQYWDIPEGHLCPPVPSRADYVHYMADILRADNAKKIPKGSKITCLDIGTGANLIYPIIACAEYGWSVIASDISKPSIAVAKAIIEQNDGLKNKVQIRLQKSKSAIFKGILKENERIDLSICNPPFYASLAEAQAENSRKRHHLSTKKTTKKTAQTSLNFGGKSHELYCEGGEKQFINAMVKESKMYALQCCWFSTLVAKEAHLKAIYATLKSVEAVEVKTINRKQGNKKSRLVAWTFLSPKQRKAWAAWRW